MKFIMSKKNRGKKTDGVVGHLKSVKDGKKWTPLFTDGDFGSGSKCYNPVEILLS